MALPSGASFQTPTLGRVGLAGSSPVSATQYVPSAATWRSWGSRGPLSALYATVLPVRRHSASSRYTLTLMPELPLTATAYPLAVAASPVIPLSSLSTVHTAVPGLGDGTGTGDGAAAAGNPAVAARRTVLNAAVTAHVQRRMPPSLPEHSGSLVSGRLMTSGW